MHIKKYFLIIFTAVLLLLSPGAHATTNYLTTVGVQHFAITIASGATTGTATINAVGSGAFIIYGGLNTAVAANSSEMFGYLTLTNSTTITATRVTSVASAIIITGCIIDADTTNLIKSVQSGTITIANTTSSGTASISAVTNSNTATHLMGWGSTNTTINPTNEYPILTLSGTTVTATRIGTSGTLTVAYEIIEFQGSALNQSVQNVAATSSASVSSFTATITSVNTANTICILAGWSNNVASVGVFQQIYGALSSSTVFTATLSGTSSAQAKKFNVSVVEFTSGILTQAVQRGTISIASGGGTSATATITSSPTAQSIITHLGNSSTGTSAQNQWENQALTNATTVTATSFSQTAARVSSYEVAEFPAYVAPPSAPQRGDAILFGMPF